MVVAAQDQTHTEANRDELAAAYGDRAVAALRQAILAGYEDVRQMKTDPSLDPLRKRADFQSLQVKLEATTQP